LGRWQNHDFTNRVDWSDELNLDQHSITTDPGFVNPAGPDGVLGFNPATTGPAMIIDDTDASFSKTGSWTTQTGGGTGGSYQQSNGGNLDVASYTFTGLTPGTFYQVSATWPANTFSSGARYAILDSGVPIASFGLDQRTSDKSLPWNNLGLFYIASGT